MTHTVELQLTKAQMDFLWRVTQPVDRFVDEADDREHLLAWFPSRIRLKFVEEKVGA